MLLLAAIGAATFKSTSAKAPAPGGTLYAELAALTPQEAKARYNQLTPDQRREVWKAKLKSVEFGKLGDEQAAFIARSLNELNGLKFDGTDRPEATKPLYEESIRLFGKADTRAIFGTLGGGNSIRAIKASLALPECTCSMDQDLCWGSQFCTNIVSCAQTEFGCGYFWANPCRGLCRTP